MHQPEPCRVRLLVRAARVHGGDDRTEVRDEVLVRLPDPVQVPGTRNDLRGARRAGGGQLQPEFVQPGAIHLEQLGIDDHLGARFVDHVDPLQRRVPIR